MQFEKDVEHVREQLAQALFDHIPVGVGSQGIIPTTAKDLEAALEMGMDWSLREACPRLLQLLHDLMCCMHWIPLDAYKHCLLHTALAMRHTGCLSRLLPQAPQTFRCLCT